jgi:hypothetical protein
MKRRFHLFLIILLPVSDGFSQRDHKLTDLDFMIGTWSVTASHRLSAGGPWDTSAAYATIIKSVGSTVIEEDYKGSLETRPFFTKTLIVFNKFTNLFQRAFIDSEHGVLTDYDGQKSDDSVIFDKDFIYPSGTTVKLRVVYKIISQDEFTLVNMRMPQDAHTWDITNTAIYIRKK